MTQSTMHMTRTSLWWTSFLGNPRPLVGDIFVIYFEISNFQRQSMRGSRGWPQLTSSQVWEACLDFVLASALSPSLRSSTGLSSALAEIWSGKTICPEYDWNFVQEKPYVKKRNYISDDLERGADEDTSPSNLYWGRVRGFEGHLVLKSGVISDFQTVIYIFKLVVKFAIRIKDYQCIFLKYKVFSWKLWQ